MANSVTLDGRLGKDAEKRGNDSGPVTFSVCHSKSKKDKITGEWENEPHWFDVITWGKLRDKALALKKGDLVLVTGRLETSKWEAQDGTKRTSVQVVADTIGNIPTNVATSTEDPDW